MTPLPLLSIDDKRQVVYSSLLRYSSELVPLRERAMNRLVLGALIGSTEDEPYRVGRIQENLRFGPSTSRIRTETLQEALTRLRQLGKVEHVELRQRHAYYLTDAASLEIGALIDSAEAPLNSVLANMLKDTADVPMDIGISVCRQFIFECFGRYGQIIARNVTGNISRETLLRNLDTRSAFAAAIEGKHLSAIAIESLSARCQLFMRSSDPEAERLKFYLTQGYYFAQLLGLEGSGFNPLNDHAFKDAVFYLDTNVLIVGILHSDETGALFDEMVDVARRLEVELRVTRATINETRGVAADRRNTLERIVDVLPEEIVGHTDDQFFLAYLAAKESDASLSPAEFLQEFDELDKTLHDRWMIGVDDRTEDEIINDRDFSREAEILNDAAMATRGWGKSETILRHDLSHYVLVSDERQGNPKTWFLTRDRTLAQAAVTLAGQGVVFCFPLSGFLQSISPFMTTTTQESSFVEIFSAILSDQVLPNEPIFEASELALMAEYHQDVMVTPPDQLLRAFDFVKLKTLQGRPYRRADIPEVSLQLRKFLSSNREEQIRALEMERTRVLGEKEAEEDRRRTAEAHSSELDSEIAKLKEEQERMYVEISSVNQLLVSQKAAQRAEQLRRRAAYMFLGLLTGLVVWHWAGTLAALTTTIWPSLSYWPLLVLLSVRLVGALVFSLPAFYCLRTTNFRNTTKLAASTIVILGALVFSRLLNSESISTIANYADVVSLIVTLAVGAGLITRNSHRDSSH